MPEHRLHQLEHITGKKLYLACDELVEMSYNVAGVCGHFIDVKSGL